MSSACTTKSFVPLKLAKDDPTQELHEFEPVPELPTASKATVSPDGASPSIISKPHCDVVPALRVTVT